MPRVMRRATAQTETRKRHLEMPQILLSWRVRNEASSCSRQSIRQYRTPKSLHALTQSFAMMAPNTPTARICL